MALPVRTRVHGYCSQKLKACKSALNAIFARLQPQQLLQTIAPNMPPFVLIHNPGIERL
jgi:hypothetical protein